MTCVQCESSKRLPHSGVYNFHCVQCCARLVATAHPNKRMASVLLAAIGRCKEAPTRQAVLNQVALDMLGMK